MEPIINPWIFYWLDVLEGVRAFIIVGMVLSGFVAGAFFLNSDCYNSKEYMAQSKKYAVVCIMCALLLVFLPAQSTIYKMVIAQQVTPQNIEMTGEALEKGLDVISDKVIKIIESEKGKNE